jgi:peptidoglycan/xylan/chitin deacetylase (PgdA/CDA1 family)
LTFDDGPSRTWTPRILDLLRRYDARATFFVVGSAVAAEPSLTRRIAREGHTIGNHTYNHADLTRLSAAGFRAEVSLAQAAIERVAGTTTRLLRPPYGAVNASTRTLAAQAGYKLVLWDVDPQDWRRPGSGSIAARILRDTRPGSLILLHDGGGDRSQTLAALEQVLATLSARGYTFAAMRDQEARR